MESFLSGIFYRTYFGLGFLDSINLVFEITKENETNNDEKGEDDKEKLSDAEQELETSSYWDSSNTWWHCTDENGIKSGFDWANVSGNINMILDNDILLTNHYVVNSGVTVNFYGAGHIVRLCDNYLLNYNPAAFISDGGNLNIYTMNIDGRNQNPCNLGNSIISVWKGNVTVNSCHIYNLNGAERQIAIENMHGGLTVNNTTIDSCNAVGIGTWGNPHGSNVTVIADSAIRVVGNNCGIKTSSGTTLNKTYVSNCVVSSPYIAYYLEDYFSINTCSARGSAEAVSCAAKRDGTNISAITNSTFDTNATAINNRSGEVNIVNGKIYSNIYCSR